MIAELTCNAFAPMAMRSLPVKNSRNFFLSSSGSSWKTSQNKWIYKKRNEMEWDGEVFNNISGNVVLIPLDRLMCIRLCILPIVRIDPSHSPRCQSLRPWVRVHETIPSLVRRIPSWSQHEMHRTVFGPIYSGWNQHTAQQIRLCQKKRVLRSIIVMQIK